MTHPAVTHTQRHGGWRVAFALALSAIFMLVTFLLLHSGPTTAVQLTTDSNGRILLHITTPTSLHLQQQNGRLHVSSPHSVAQNGRRLASAQLAASPQQPVAITFGSAPSSLSLNLTDGADITLTQDNSGVSLSAATALHLSTAQLSQPLHLQASHIRADGAISASQIDISGQTITLLPGSRLTAVHAISLHASHTLTIRDSATRPFIAQAGGNLQLQGDRLIDISALAHSGSRLASGGDMTLTSANPVRGDALYLSGGQVQIAQLNGRFGHLVSPNDPIILASGDVSLGDYTGASLHIIAGGAVALEAITITSTDLTANTVNAANTTPFNGSDTLADLATFNLSNGTAVAIDGSSQPLLDVRAGVDWSTFGGGAPSNQVLPPGSTMPIFAAASSADISVSGGITVTQPGGRVLLTNQYRPNAALAGSISVANVDVSSATAQAAGDIIVDAKGDINTGQLDAFAEVTGTAVTVGDGGTITLLAPTGALATSGSLNTFSRVPGNSSGDAGAGGNVLVEVASGISIDSGVNSFAFANSDGGTGNGGEIVLKTASGDITVPTLSSFSFIVTDTVAAASGGDITVSTAAGSITVAGDGFFTAVSSFSQSFGAGGAGGNVAMSATQGIAIGQSVRAYGTGQNASGGSVQIQTSSGNIVVGDVLAQASFSGDSGSGGDVSLLASNGAVTSGAVQTFSVSFFINNDAQDGGDILIAAGNGDVQAGIVESYTQARGADGDTGNAGLVSISASGGIFTSDGINASALAAQNNGNSGIAGSGGAVTLQATTAVSVTGGINTYSSAPGPNGTAANGANITLSAPSGEIRIAGDVNAYASAAGFPSGDAGDGGSITLTAGTGIAIPTGQLNAYTLSQEGTVGNGGSATAVTTSGDIVLESVNTSAQNTFADSSLGTGSAGNITLTTNSGAIIVNPDDLNLFFTVSSEVAGPDSIGDGGDIALSATQQITINGDVRAATLGNIGNAGNISLSSGGNITTDRIVAAAIDNDNSPGNGGNVVVQAANGAVAVDDVLAYSLSFFINNSTANGGAITIEALGGDATTGQLASYSEARGADGDTGSGGDIVVTTSGDLTTAGSVQAYALSAINNSNSGVAASGGDVSLQASGTISIGGSIDTFSAAPGPNGVAANAGNVTATAVADIAFTYIDGRSRAATGSIGNGSTVILTSGQLVRGVGIPLFDGDDTIATSGLANSSAITITHGGAGITPFVVGDASSNGTTADITTGEATLAPTASFLYSHFEEPNLWILSVPLPLTLTKSATPSVDVPFRGEISYTIVLTNPTATAANGVTLADTLPVEVDFNRWGQQPAGADVVGDVLTWRGNLPANSSLTFEFVVDHVGAIGDVFTNTAVFTHPDSLGSGTAAATVSIEAASDVTIQKVANVTTAVPGAPIQYTLTFSNTGDGLARDVIITDTIPVALTNLNVSSSGATITPIAGQTFAWAVQDLAANEGGEMIITGDLVTPLPSGTEVVNTAVITTSSFDANSNNNTDSVTITILNDAPQAVDDMATTDEDTPVNILLLNNDGDGNGDTLTLAAVGAAANGTAVANGNTVDYTPTLNFFGTDTFTYTVSDGTLSSSALVTVTVNAVNDPPLALDNSYNTAEDTTLTVIAAAGILSNDTDVEGDALTAVLVDDVAVGGLTLAADGGFVYVPALNFSGLVTFTYQADDSAALSNTALVAITVGEANDPPLAVPDEAETDEDTAVTIDVLANDTDPDADTLIVIEVTTPANGTAVILGNQIVYTPTLNFNGNDTLSYTVSDGQETAQAQVLIGVNPINDAPQFTSTPLTTAQANVLYSYPAVASDVDTGDTMVIEALTLPAWLTLLDQGDGTAVLSGTPSDADAGDHRVVLQVMDQGELIDTQEFTITVRTITYTYLPLIFNSYAPPIRPSDLVITNVSVTASSVTVVIENQGPGPTPDAFWVDFYINPTETPRLNRTWQLIAEHGVAWGVTEVIPPGGSLTLTLGDSYFDPSQSDFAGLTVGDVVWAQVDSVNLATAEGNVSETDETNNVFGPVTFIP